MVYAKDKIIKELLAAKIDSRNDLMLEKRKLAKKYGIGILQNSDILNFYQKNINKGLKGFKPGLARILRKRSIRTMSGIAPVAVLTKPYQCPGKCAYCPTEKDVPQSYLSNEPAVMRAIRCGFDPYVQVQYRLRALEANGHEPTKIELIVIGGTWSYFPVKYKYWYIVNLFAAANNYSSKIKIDKSEEYKPSTKIEDLKKYLQKEQKRNEKAKYKIIGLTLETRPDYINDEELWQMRELGCTRVEIGVQAIDDEILKLNKRGHGVAEIAKATEMLKNYGFKVTYHIMPGLPGSTPAKDFKMYKQLFSDARFQPDQIKFYPTVVTKDSLLYRWWKTGKYKPYSDKVLQNLIIKCKAITPVYVRIIRLIRDIPGESIVAGNMITNLRQIMKDKGVECSCIRCREAGEAKLKVGKLKVIKYKASGGEEHFISCDSKDGKILYGFCRLRLPLTNVIARSGTTKQSRYHRDRHVLTPNLRDGTRDDRDFFQGAALVRELHVYGELVPVGENKKVQHSGLGKKMLLEAEKIAKQHGHKKMVIISGVGVRGYYKRLGYKLVSSYMVKKLV